MSATGDGRRWTRRLPWLGIVAALVLGVALVWLGGTPSQVGSRLSPVTDPLGQAPPAPSTGATAFPGTCSNVPGTPVSITVVGARAQDALVEAHPLGASIEDGGDPGALYVPPDPSVVSWLAYPDVGPGASHGTAVFTSHVNYGGVVGAFGDITTYRPGQQVIVTLADGRVLPYHVVAPSTLGFNTTDPVLEISKTQLDSDTSLNRRIFDFHGSWSEDGGPPCGRLVIVTCSGRLVNHNYMDNAFAFALPDQ